MLDTRETTVRIFSAAWGVLHAAADVTEKTEDRRRALQFEQLRGVVALPGRGRHQLTSGAADGTRSSSFDSEAGAMAQQLPTDAAETTDTAPVSLLEHFSRFMMVVQIDPERVANVIGLTEAVHVPRRAGPRPLWVPLSDDDRDQQCRYLLPWVHDYLRGEVPRGSRAPDRDCTAYRWDPDICSRFRRKLTVSIRNVDTRFGIDECEVYFFSTGIVVVAVECCLAAQPGGNLTVQELADFDYYMARLDPHQALKIRQDTQAVTGAAGTTTAGFLSPLRTPDGMTLDQVMREGLSPVFALPSAECLDRRMLKVMTFARVSADHRPEQLGALFYQLRRVVKESYPAAPRDVRVEDSDDVVRTFANIAIGFSLEGFAVLLWDNGHPFYNEFSIRVRRSYFAHYLLGLHQRSALLALALNAGRLPRMTHAALPQDEHLFATIGALRFRAADFNLHHRFSQASTMTHYAQVYDRLNRALGIPALLEEVRDEVTELDEILNVRRERLRVEQAARDAADRERVALEDARGDRLLNQIVAILGPLSLLLSLFGTNLPGFAGPGTYRSLWFALPLTGWVMLTASLWWLVRRKPKPSD